MRTDINWVKVGRELNKVRSTGGSVKRFLKGKGIPYSTYYHASKRGWLEDGNTKIKVKTKDKGEFVEFVSTKESPITLTTKDGITISVPAGNVTALKTALAALREE